MSAEQFTSPEFQEKVLSQEHERRIEAHTSPAELAGEEAKLADLGEQARAVVEQQAITQENPIEALNATEKAPQDQPSLKQVSKQHLKLTGAQEIRRVQRQEKLADKTLSKVIHQPVVRAVSEGAAKTVTRPSGLLGGGIMAFVGTVAYTYYAKHIGVEYNYLLSLLFFVAGFALGLIIDLGVWTVTHNRVRE